MPSSRVLRLRVGTSLSCSAVKGASPGTLCEEETPTSQGGSRQPLGSQALVAFVIGEQRPLSTPQGPGCWEGTFPHLETCLL